MVGVALRVFAGSSLSLSEPCSLSLSNLCLTLHVCLSASDWGAGFYVGHLFALAHQVKDQDGGTKTIVGIDYKLECERWVIVP